MTHTRICAACAYTLRDDVMHALRDDVMHAGTILPFRKQDVFRLTWWTNWFNFWGGILFCVGYVMIVSHGNQ